jgi:hypothetical protein
MSLVLLFHYLLLNMFRMLVHSSSEACELLWIYYFTIYCSACFECQCIHLQELATYCGFIISLFTAQHVSNVSVTIFRSLRIIVDLLFNYLLLNMFRMLVHPSSGACDLFWLYRNTNTHRTRAIQHMK